VTSKSEVRSFLRSVRAAAAGLAILLAVLCSDPVQAVADQVKLTSPGTGWLARGSSLFWTRDNGQRWIDITPVPRGISRARVAASVRFFRSDSEAWEVISYPDQVSSATSAPLGSEQTIYILAHTMNSGANWSFSRLTYPGLPDWIQEIVAGPSDLYFLDSLNGWLNIALAGNSKPGKLLRTEDGGKTWNWVNGPGVSGPVNFASMRDGWVLGYFGGERLFVTHNGGKTWRDVTMPVPQGVGSARYPGFQGTPVFLDGKRGFLLMNYSGDPGTPVKLVLYATRDTGYTWQPTSMIGEAAAVSAGAGFAFSVVESALIVGRGVSEGNIAVAQIPLEGSGSFQVNASGHGILALTFADVAHGWAMNAAGRVLATSDGGSTWKDITPNQ